MQIVVEGLDGVGKSTLAEGLAARLGAALDGTPGAAVSPLRAMVDEHWPPLARQLFYAGSVAAASGRMAAARSAGRATVFDRYWCATFAYDVAIRRTGFSLDNLEARLCVPDLTVLLDAPLATRAVRLNGRSQLSGEDHHTLDPAVDRALRAAYLEALGRPATGPSVIVDATATPAAMLAQVLRHLESRSDAR